MQQTSIRRIFRNTALIATELGADGKLWCELAFVLLFSSIRAFSEELSKIFAPIPGGGL